MDSQGVMGKILCVKFCVLKYTWSILSNLKTINRSCPLGQAIFSHQDIIMHG